MERVDSHSLGALGEGKATLPQDTLPCLSRKSSYWVLQQLCGSAMSKPCLPWGIDGNSQAPRDIWALKLRVTWFLSSDSIVKTLLQTLGFPFQCAS